MAVRRAEARDAAAIARVHVATWRSAYDGLLPDDFLASMRESTYEGRWGRILANLGIRVYVAEQAGAVVGFASCGRERAGETAYQGELFSIYVLAEAQGQGHGRELMRSAVDGLREVGLRDMIVWVLRDNRGARGFYERLGGVYVREQVTTIGPVAVPEVSYGWRNLADVRFSSAGGAGTG